MVDKVHDTGGGPLQTSMPNKRNLSNSSISPKVADKKSKIFVTPNRFAALYSEDSSDTVFITSTNSASARNEKPGPANQSIEQPTLDVQDVTPRAPPFYISNISNFSAFTNELTKLTGPNAFTYASNAVETIAPRTVLRIAIVQPNARSVLRFTRPTTKDVVFINPLPKNALKCSQESCQSQISPRPFTPDAKENLGLTQKQLWAIQII
ncbi:uncharacterized protein LOC111033546 [Myzus persicae]|uniref:uncharacterized protein LOC111033546 n=1 Tax=Myzus persicae TaxID=13164 RepID=UPI000B9379B2|nr:uncharacterized protein LOC111033546 [Myzus persicae]